MLDRSRSAVLGFLFELDSRLLVGTSTSDSSVLLLLDLVNFNKNENPATKQYTAAIINNPTHANGRRSNDDKKLPQNEIKFTTEFVYDDERYRMS
jgi:hypothetical protein